MMKNVVNKQHGFTLLELVVVVAIMGLIASLATEYVVQDANQARYDLTKERRANIRTALANYYDDCGAFPENLDWLVLKAKVDAVSNTKCGSTANENWAGPYIVDVDFENGNPVYRDGWGNASAALSADFGWNYNENGASVALATYGLDGGIGQSSGAGSDEYVFEADEGAGFTLLTSNAPTSAYELRSITVSGASPSYSVLECYTDSSSSAVVTSMSFCLR